MNFLEKIFSVKNNNYHKIVTICGIEVSFKNKYKILEDKIESLQNRIKQLSLEQDNNKKLFDKHKYVLDKRFEQFMLVLNLIKNGYRVLNSLIDKIDDCELKEFQIKTIFSLLHKNPYNLNFNNPKSFNEKIQWMSLNYYADNDEIHRIVDKYQFKEYIEEKLGTGYTVPLLGKWNTPNEINYDILPNQFVLKSNWGGDGKQVKIIKNKDKLNITELNKELSKWISFEGNMYYYAFNGPCKKAKPCIIAEEYVEGLGTEFYDYKVFCFNGKAEFVYVTTNWTLSEHMMTYYDTNWNKLDLRYSGYEHLDMPKPKNLDKMLELATKLSKNFPFVRVDFFDLEDKVVLSEMTFTPGGGFGKYDPIEWDYKLGDMLDISHLIEEKTNA